MKFAARTNAEAHLYMDLHPCVCGDTAFARKSAVHQDGEGLVSVYQGACTGCGLVRTFEFVLPDRLIPPTRRINYGGDEPSAIIDPGEFIAVADLHAKRVPANTGALSPAERTSAGKLMQIATAALEEVLKFIPEGADAVPAEAFVSEAGRAQLHKEPGRFSRERLDAVLEVYRSLLDQLAG